MNKIYIAQGLDQHIHARLQYSRNESRSFWFELTSNGEMWLHNLNRKNCDGKISIWPLKNSVHFNRASDDDYDEPEQFSFQVSGRECVKVYDIAPDDFGLWVELDMKYLPANGNNNNT